MENYEYFYDPVLRHLECHINGKLVGGFENDSAEEQFSKKLDKANTTVTLISMDKEQRRKGLVRKLRALWINQGVDKYRESIMEPYGVTSTADLKISELEELIEKFSNPKPANEAIRKQRSVCLVLLNNLGIYATNNDWSKVNSFLMNKRVAGKKLNQLSLDELKTLQIKLRAILKKDEATNIGSSYSKN